MADARDAAEAALALILRMGTFGAPAPPEALQTKSGFTPADIVAAAKDLLARDRRLNQTGKDQS